MKFLPSQLLYFIQGDSTRRNVKRLLKFIAILIIMATAYSILFHVIMRYEDRDFSWLTGLYWTLTVMTTLGFGDIIVEKNPRAAGDSARLVVGSASDLDILVKAGLREASSVIVTTHNDDLNIYLTLYCRRLQPDLQILSRATLERNVSTLHRAGADMVMSYASMGASIILNLLRPDQLLFLEEATAFASPAKHKTPILGSGVSAEGGLAQTLDEMPGERAQVSASDLQASPASKGNRRL